jgi:uncharacterized protein (DUF433 family)
MEQVQYCIDSHGTKTGVVIPIELWEELLLQLAARQLPNPKRLAKNSDWSEVVVSDHEVLGGAPIFPGTRVPFQTLIDYLSAGDSVESFLDNYPSVQKFQVIRAIQLIKDSLVNRHESVA